MRNRALTRFRSYTKAKRKKELDRAIYPDGPSHPFYDNLHQYSKNKIHCSCAWCSRKSKNKGKRRFTHANYDRTHNYKASDLKMFMAMDDDEMDFFNSRLPKRRTPPW